MGSRNTPYAKLKRSIVLDHLEKFPDAGSRTIARILFRDFPKLFLSEEEARTPVRMYRGVNGKHHRNVVKMTKYYKNEIKLAEKQ